jgi:hypothetical protein
MAGLETAPLVKDDRREFVSQTSLFLEKFLGCVLVQIQPETIIDVWIRFESPFSFAAETFELNHQNFRRGDNLLYDFVLEVWPLIFAAGLIFAFDFDRFCSEELP